MKILISTVQAPFIKGGAELLASNLKNALLKAGHEAEIVSVPFMDNPNEMIVDHIVAARMYDINYTWAGKIDLNIGLKFPAYYMPHDNKVLWVLHQHRAAYELFDTDYSSLKNNPEDLKIRNAVIAADNLYMNEAKRVYTIAKNVTKRMDQYNKIKSEALYHPCPDMDKFYTKECEDYILMPSRINTTKRQVLAIEAMRYSKTKTKLYIVGKADNDYEKNRMLSLIKEYKLQDKIKYFDYISQEEKFEMYAKSKAILFIPLDEDYGYITLEAMAAGKPVITAKDSGGPLEFVDNGRNGFVVEPSAKEIAKVFDEVAKSSAISVELGVQSKNKLVEMNITWENVVKELIK